MANVIVLVSSFLTVLVLTVNDGSLAGAYMMVQPLSECVNWQWLRCCLGHFSTLVPFTSSTEFPADVLLAQECTIVDLGAWYRQTESSIA